MSAFSKGDIVRATTDFGFVQPGSIGVVQADNGWNYTVIFDMFGGDCLPDEIELVMSATEYQKRVNWTP